MVVVADATTGPTFKVSKIDNATFLFQWIEWLKIGDIPTSGKLATTDTSASFFQGAYASADGPFLNPLTRLGLHDTLTTDSSSTATWKENRASFNYGGKGSVGDLRYHTEDAGVVSDYTTSTGDIQIFWKMQELKNAEYNAYITKLNSFESLKTTYETDLNARNAQITEDFLGFAEALVVPERPEMPTRPFLYAGPTPDLSKYSGSGAITWKAKASENGGKAALQA